MGCGGSFIEEYEAVAKDAQREKLPPWMREPLQKSTEGVQLYLQIQEEEFIDFDILEAIGKLDTDMRDSGRSAIWNPGKGTQNFDTQSYEKVDKNLFNIQENLSDEQGTE
ncbi:hypothetical protein SS50377_20684 [Spironucleus salmonicida]|uniref:Uncharacterized protein n=1 Tax=Spironucleus salmonicida TaxID=348837 RepID=V6LZ28_9EUKA|nr:hypothetical protein SS50377_20684 [Spironucleus salmonicida]|eukprot:EST49533.1 Hypothetical protein SS50377_10137 [Spironucleus salmonicida]